MTLTTVQVLRFHPTIVTRGSCDRCDTCSTPNPVGSRVWTNAYPDLLCDDCYRQACAMAHVAYPTQPERF